MTVVGVLATSALSLRIAAAEPADDAESGRTSSRSTGAIEGTIIYRPDPLRPWRYARYYVADRERGELAEAVVALAPTAPWERDPTVEPGVTVIDQKNFQFKPETIAIRAGDRIHFTNSDAEVHNVQTFHPLHQFNVNMPSHGEHVESFAHAGGLKRPYRIGCVYHSDMRAWVYVFDHPYFRVTSGDGRFRLRDVPPGEYALEMAHPAGELKWSRAVEIRPGQTTRLDIVVSPDDKVDAARKSKP
jgi:plastocyanin